jgi:hypothetical protein
MTHRRRRQLRPGAARDSTDVGSEATLMIVNVGEVADSIVASIAALPEGSPVQAALFPTETADAIGGNGDVAVTAPDGARIKEPRGT